MLPQVMRALDAVDPSLNLGSQYITIMEVGGAYAQLFIPLLEFLDLRSLIITDLDAVKRNAKKKLEACLVHEGSHKQFLHQVLVQKRPEAPPVPQPPAEEPATKPVAAPQAAPAIPAPATAETAAAETADDDEEEVADGATLFPLSTALAADIAAKTRSSLRLACQVPEASGGPCRRTLEDAFVSRTEFFGITGATNDALRKPPRTRPRSRRSRGSLTYAMRKPTGSRLDTLKRACAGSPRATPLSLILSWRSRQGAGRQCD